MALFVHWLTLGSPQCHQRAPVVLLRRLLARQKLSTPSKLSVLVCGRLFSRLEPILFTVNHLNVSRSLICNLGTRPVADCKYFHLVHGRGDHYHYMPLYSL